MLYCGLSSIGNDGYCYPLLSIISSVHFSRSVMPNSLQPMDCNTPDLPVHHQFPAPAQTHVHRVGDAIQPSHPLSSPSPHAFNLSQPSGSFQMSQLFASDGQSIGVSASTSVLLMNIQDWFPLGYTGWISLLSNRLSRKSLLQNHSSKASVLQCSVFFMA